MLLCFGHVSETESNMKMPPTISIGHLQVDVFIDVLEL
jgi:hypothetical protein